MRTLLRAPRYTASSNRRTKSGSLCFHSSVNPGFRVLKTFSLRSKKPSSVIQFASSNAASRTVQFKTSPKPRCQDHDRFRPPRARANDVHVLNQLFPLRNIFITLPSPPFVLIGARAVRFRAVSTLISPICVHLVQPTTSKDSKKHPPLTRTSPKLSPRFASSLSLSLSQRVPSRTSLPFAAHLSRDRRPTLERVRIHGRVDRRCAAPHCGNGRARALSREHRRRHRAIAPSSKEAKSRARWPDVVFLKRKMPNPRFFRVQIYTLI
jgi:hypothetical protein